MKTMYSVPEMEVVKFMTEDVIATSGLVNGGVDDSDEMFGPIQG